ncbi:hypothetical protein ABT063_03970 [Streptomyces sp. NPDC002838]|uniref:hypothetical protein n=1 Tax=Streptomyces sp. NPDC002838 TaxID=3154436 RepID=UPI003317C4A6
MSPQVIAVPLVAGFPPESMSFLLSKSRTAEAHQLARRYGVDATVARARPGG